MCGYLIMNNLNTNSINRYGAMLLCIWIQVYLYKLVEIYNTYSFDYVLQIYVTLLFCQVIMNTICFVISTPFENNCRHVLFSSHLLVSFFEFSVILYYNIYVEIPIFTLCLFIISFINTMIENNNYRFVCDLVFTIMKSYVFISYYMENVLEINNYSLLKMY